MDDEALPALTPDFLYAALDATAYSAFVKESRKKRGGATKLHRKSGGAHDRAETLSRSAKALLPPHKCGASTVVLFEAQGIERAAQLGAKSLHCQLMVGAVRQTGNRDGTDDART